MHQNIWEILRKLYCNNFWRKFEIFDEFDGKFSNLISKDACGVFRKTKEISK